MTCPCCDNTGYRTAEVPVFRDDGYSDVEQIADRCACNPEPTDEDYDVCDGCWAPEGSKGRCIGCRAPIPTRSNADYDDCAPTDEDYLAAHPWHDDRAGWPGETEYPADLVLPVVDFDALLPA